MTRRGHIKDLWKEQRLFIGRALFAAIFVTVALSLVIARLFYLQVVRHDYFVQASQGNRVRLEPLPANRGLILDRNGTVLVDNQPGYQLELIPEQTPNIDFALRRLVEIGLVAAEDVDQVRRTIRSHRPFDSVPIRLVLSDEELATFAVHRYEFRGVDIRTRQTRHYRYGTLGSHMLGYVSAINADDLAHIDSASYAGTSLIGKLGIEASYEPQLHGRNGSREVLVNAEGRSVDKVGSTEANLKSEVGTAGADLRLSIDLPSQEAAEKGLGTHRGAVVAIDPNNGDIIALASTPGFDPGGFAHGLSRSEFATLTDDPNKPLINRALRGTYPSGSTIKPVIALAGLTDKVISSEKILFCPGTWHLPGSRLEFREGKTGRHGAMDMEHAIAKSCDVYFYSLASTLGVDRIASFMASFGYGALTGIDIGGEKPGILPSREWKRRTFSKPAEREWYPGETVNFGVGQGYLLVTPLQLAHVASALALRGRSFRPRLVTAIGDAANHQMTAVAPIENPPVVGVSEADWDVVMRGMRGAAVYGTAAAISKGATYTIAGKTGTAQVFTVSRSVKLTDKVAEALKDHSWFIAFAPAEAPRIAVAVLVENGGFGSMVAAPIARKVMDTYLLGVAKAGPPEAIQDPTTPPDASTAE
jgi:penicillin-binding protein 2